MDDNQIKISFSYTDRFGQIYDSTKTYNQRVLNSFDNNDIPLMCQSFLEFLHGSGFDIAEISKYISVKTSLKE